MRNGKTSFHKLKLKLLFVKNIKMKGDSYFLSSANSE